MKKREPVKPLSIIFAGLLGLVLVSSAYAADEKKTEIAALSQLMQAIADNDYDAFRADGTAEFKQTITKQAFNSVHAQLGKLVRNGYTAIYLGDLYQKGRIAHLWKISYNNSKENSLAKMIIVDGKAAGFWLF